MPGKKSTGAQKTIDKIAADKAALREKVVHLSLTFDAHIFYGEKDGTKHKGLHSMVRVQASKPAPKITVIETDAETGAYAAWVKLPNYSDSKASTFFPNDLRDFQVTALIKEAFQNYREKPAEGRTMIAGAALSWAGAVQLEKNGKSVSMWIGGLGDGDKKDGIATAFPMVGGSFKDPNNSEKP